MGLQSQTQIVTNTHTHTHTDPEITTQSKVKSERERQVSRLVVLNVAVPAWDLLKEVTIIFITFTIV